MSNNFDILEALWLRKEKKRREQKIIEGAPPLTYTAKKAGTLTDYRIYGNTVGGESVGDRTGNLFDGEWITGYVPLVATGKIVQTSNGSCTDYISIVDGNIIFSSDSNVNIYLFLYDENKNFIGMHSGGNSGLCKGYTIINYMDAKYAVLRIDSKSAINGFWYMLNTGSTASPYEPYGYKVPIALTNSGTTSNETIYLPEQLKKVGDEAEYIDYAEQKQHFVGGTSVDVTLPALPTIAGTNTLSVGTEVQPSKVMVRGKLKE